ncbi:MAG: hypothetical protein P3W95_005535, partial [Tepidimonas taiwanensis]|nr:hypothetical protein [Tepidimonas taiwanensis]
MAARGAVARRDGAALAGAAVAVAAVLAGGAHALALAWPWDVSIGGWLAPGQPAAWLHALSLMALVALLAHAPTASAAAWRAGGYATAWLAGTFWWLFVSMHTYGGLVAPLAVLAVLALAAFLALDYALAAALWSRWRTAGPGAQVLAFAALWTLAEWARGVLWTGFPWGAGGYAQVEALGALAPWVGVYGIGAVAAALAAAPVLLRGGARVVTVVLAALVWGVPGAGAWLAERLPDTTRPAGARGGRRPRGPGRAGGPAPGAPRGPRAPGAGGPARRAGAAARAAAPARRRAAARAAPGVRAARGGGAPGAGAWLAERLP